LAKPNYQFEKRQKELAKKSKKEEKRRQKLKDNTGAEGDSQEVSGAVISGDDLPGTEKN
jgi:hypothetical protein